jgi:hypothetical protein
VATCGARAAARTAAGVISETAKALKPEPLIPCQRPLDLGLLAPALWGKPQ